MENTTPRTDPQWQNPIVAMFAKMTPREKRKFYAEYERQRYMRLPAELTETPMSDEERQHWPGLLKSWRSREFSVAAYEVKGVSAVLCRLSINRVQIDPNTGMWVSNITWDELYSIKNRCGFADLDAIEVYPAEAKLQNVSNMRHLWVMTNLLGFGL